MYAFFSIFVSLLGLYFLIGLLFALLFVFRGAGRVDSNAQASGIGFRLLILPGTMALWPVMMRRWLQAPKDEAK